MTNRAISTARRLSRSPHPTDAVGYCLRQVRTAFGVGPTSPPTDDAIEGWERAQHRHPVQPGDRIPRGVPVWWSGGSAGHGHVAISTGTGKVWSTDIIRPGYFDRISLDDFAARWPNLTLLGWTEDINGVRVYTPREHQ